MDFFLIKSFKHYRGLGYTPTQAIETARADIKFLNSIIF